MLDTRIKICGITSPEDAELATSLGADYLGLIFAESARGVTREQAQAIRRAVPTAMLVGVFVDAPIAEVVETSHACGLNIIQLHGSEPPQYCDALLQRLALPIIKAFSIGQLTHSQRLRDYRRTSYFLLDLDKDSRQAQREFGPNGTQERLWSEAARKRGKGYRIFLAGGLDPSNVGEAVRRVRPYCIDVARGVEKSPGVKDAQAMRRFIQETRQ